MNDSSLATWHPTETFDLQMTGEGKHAAYEYRCNDCGETFEQRRAFAARHGEAEVPEVRKREGLKAFFAFYARTSKKS